MRRSVLLDLDGTLLDSGEQVAEVAARTLASFGLVGADLATLQRRTGEPATALFQEVDDPTTRERLVIAFRADLAEVAGGRDQVMPDVFEGLRELRSQGWLLGVATNKPTALALAVLARSELFDLVDHVQGSDGLPHKPAPDVLWTAERSLGCRARWMVGDTTIDVLAGRNAGIATIAVTGGSHGVDELAAAAPDVLVHSFRDAIDTIIRESGRSS